MTNSLAQGDLDAVFNYFGLNTYPVILLIIHRLGFDVIRGAAWWGVLVSSLAALPLYGLTWRIFGRRVAALTCVLYAVHPMLTAHSPHMFRDPTCWLFYLLTLYLFWRAVSEVRGWLFLAAGVALTLAVHTRSEAWLLLIPIGGWALWRWRVDMSNRWRLAAGTAVCLATVPVSIVLVNVALLGEQAYWKLECRRFLVEVDWWVRGVTPPSTTSSASVPIPIPGANSVSVSPKDLSQNVTQPPSIAAEPVGSGIGDKMPAPPTLRFSTWTAFRKTLVRFPKALSFLFSLLALTGIWVLRRRLLTAPILPLILVAIVLLTVISLRMTVTLIDPRYYLTAVLVLLPGAAVGLLQWCAWMVYLVHWISPSRGRLATSAAIGCVLVVTLLGGAEGLYQGRALAKYWQQRVVLGKWIASHLGPDLRIADSSYTHRLVVYYAQGKVDQIPEGRTTGRDAALASVSTRQPDVIVLWEQDEMGWAPDVRQAVLDQHREMGYRKIPAEQLPPPCQQVMVLVLVSPERPAAHASAPANRKAAQ